MKIIKYLLILFFVFTAQAQYKFKAKIVLDSVMKKQLKLKTVKYGTYITVKGLNSDRILEQSNGFYIKNGHNHYQKLGGIEIIMTKEFYIKIDPKYKRMEYLINPPQNENYLGETDALQLLNYFKDNGHYSYKELDSEHVLDLISKSGITIPYSKIELFIAKHSYRINKSILYFNSLIGNSNKSFDYPVMETKFHSYTTTLSASDLDKFKLNYYLYNDSGVYKPQAKYSKYKIVRLH